MNKTETNQQAQAKPQAQPVVLCKECHSVVTEPEAAIQVEGGHEHTFRNPAGYSFHVLCYASAPGTIEVGAPTEAASWFPGYAWSLALCANCHQHLGWWYEGKSIFVGLIATRLVRSPS
ncbi:MAG: hypothetical protein KF760_28235 [Candidatus Eremiobacteraeota bacterium]|nr:hypothetical protein [Candidatus Eremiobacteraeota bacterium]MCW5865785.1 hypothetical protein [Candidatus Eremiobacteraeota bacterium]